MKMKILYVCFTLSFFINMALGIYLLKREPVCGHLHIDVVDRTKDVIPDRETAVRLAREMFMDRISENYPYEYHVLFNEPSYEWIVFIYPKRGTDYVILDGSYIVWLRRDYGILNNYCR